jgi:hypothetical protein
MKVVQTNNNGAGGLGLVIVAGAVAAAVAVFDWIGQHAAQISAGIGVLFHVIAAVAILAAAGAGWLAWCRYRQRAAGAAEPEPVQAVQAVPELVPVRLPAGEPPLELPPGGTTLHFPDVSPAEVAELVEALKNRNRL